MRDKKSTIALVFAGGVASQFQDGDVAPLKALLPVGGQPIANYVLRALEQSQVEKIFIIQDEETSLEEALSASDKCVFVRRDRHHRSLASSMKFGIKKAAAYYGPTLIQQKSILFVPCDLPLANKDNFNALIQQAAEKDADVLLTFISENLVKRRFPQKIRFRSAYAADLKERYTIQMVGFLNGGIIQCDPSGGPEIATLRR
jgi:molybdopterin-guanine dinucleotide biosynthesis protein A